MGTINYTYEPNQTVWVITPVGSCPSAVQKSVIIQVRATVLTTETTVSYDVRIGDQKGTSTFVENDIFATLSDATTEYQARLT